MFYKLIVSKPLSVYLYLSRLPGLLQTPHVLLFLSIPISNTRAYRKIGCLFCFNNAQIYQFPMNTPKSVMQSSVLRSGGFWDTKKSHWGCVVSWICLVTFERNTQDIFLLWLTWYFMPDHVEFIKLPGKDVEGIYRTTEKTSHAWLNNLLKYIVRVKWEWTNK